jgi:hypothetical protein
VAPQSISTGDIYRGIIPFVVLQVLAIAVLWMAPGLATWLPKQVFPDTVPVQTAPAPGGGGTPGSILDDILKTPSAGAGTPTPSGSPLDQILNQPVTRPKE